MNFFNKKIKNFQVSNFISILLKLNVFCVTLKLKKKYPMLFNTPNTGELSETKISLHRKR